MILSGDYMKIIKLHYNGESRYFNADNISAFHKYDKYTWVYVVGDRDAFYADESPEEIVAKILDTKR